MNILLLTQNIGSIECHAGADGVVSSANRERLNAWCASVAALVQGQGDADNAPSSSSVDILVLHLQEIGGKQWSGPLNSLLQNTIHECHPGAVWCSGVLGAGLGTHGSNTNAKYDPSTFTALGTVIFLSQRAVDAGAALWAFDDNNTNGAYHDISRMVEKHQAHQAGSLQPSHLLDLALAAALVTLHLVQQHTLMTQCVGAAAALGVWMLLLLLLRGQAAQSQRPATIDNKQRQRYWKGAKFATAGKSRKGYLQTRLRLPDNVLNFCNLHLFHDADNRVAASRYTPSEYTHKRQAALVETLQAMNDETNGSTFSQNATFIFGDWNLRLDQCALKAHLEQKFYMTVGLDKKKIDYHNNNQKKSPTNKSQKNKNKNQSQKNQMQDVVQDYFQDASHWPNLRERFDREPPLLKKAVLREVDDELILSEQPIHFGPTYLLVDDADDNNDDDDTNDKDDTTRHYQLDSRFPAWCDRIWYNPAAKRVLEQGKDNDNGIEYATAPLLHPMDHLAVYLQFQI